MTANRRSIEKNRRSRRICQSIVWLSSESLRFFQDPLLSYLLQQFQPRWIIRYHEHSTLLEDQVDERLTDEEKKVAWEQYELEKKGLRGGPADQVTGIGPSPDPAALAQLQRDADRRQQFERIAAARLQAASMPPPVVNRTVTLAELEEHLLRQQRENPAVFASNMMVLRQLHPQMYSSMVSKYPDFRILQTPQSSSRVGGVQPSILHHRQGIGLSVPTAAAYATAAASTAGAQAPRVLQAPSLAARLQQAQPLARMPASTAIVHQPN